MAGRPMLGRPPSSTPKARLAPMTKNSGFQAHLPILSPSAVSTTSAWNMITAPRMRQQDAQHQREVAGPHAGAVADVVGGGADREGAPHRCEHDSRKEVSLTLDAHCLDPR